MRVAGSTAARPPPAGKRANARTFPIATDAAEPPLKSGPNGARRGATRWRQTHTGSPLRVRAPTPRRAAPRRAAPRRAAPRRPSDATVGGLTPRRSRQSASGGRARYIFFCHGIEEHFLEECGHRLNLPEFC
jgi:hypothetical protein